MSTGITIDYADYERFMRIERAARAWRFECARIAECVRIGGPLGPHARALIAAVDGVPVPDSPPTAPTPEPHQHGDPIGMAARGEYPPEPRRVEPDWKAMYAELRRVLANVDSGKSDWAAAVKVMQRHDAALAPRCPSCGKPIEKP